MASGLSFVSLIACIFFNGMADGGGNGQTSQQRQVPSWLIKIEDGRGQLLGTGVLVQPGSTTPSITIVTSSGIAQKFRGPVTVEFADSRTATIGPNSVIPNDAAGVCVLLLHVDESRQGGLPIAASDTLDWESYEAIEIIAWTMARKDDKNHKYVELPKIKQVQPTNLDKCGSDAVICMEEKSPDEITQEVSFRSAAGFPLVTYQNGHEALRGVHLRHERNRGEEEPHAYTFSKVTQSLITGMLGGRGDAGPRPRGTNFQTMIAEHHL